MNIGIDNDYSYTYPPTLQRIMDISSVQHKHLWGERSKFIRNFDTVVGAKNRGDLLDITKYVVTPGVPLVAHEFYSDNYILIVPKFLKQDF